MKGRIPRLEDCIDATIQRDNWKPLYEGEQSPALFAGERVLCAEGVDESRTGVVCCVERNCYSMVACMGGEVSRSTTYIYFVVWDTGAMESFYSADHLTRGDWPKPEHAGTDIVDGIDTYTPNLVLSAMSHATRDARRDANSATRRRIADRARADRDSANRHNRNASTLGLRFLTWASKDANQHYALGEVLRFQKYHEKPGDRKAMLVLVPELRRFLPMQHAAAAPTAPGCATVRENEEKGGIEIRFPSKPDASILEQLKRHGWRWSRFGSCWYTKATEEARAFAASLNGEAVAA